MLFCSNGSDGIFVHGLTDWDRHQVGLRGWGRLKGHGVLLHLPRDSDELEVCWNLLRRAYESLRADLARLGPTRPVWPYDMPRFSRTALQ